MRRFIVAALFGLTIVATISTSASAFQCLARSPNGASGWGFGISLNGPNRLQCGGAYSPEEISMDTFVISPAVIRKDAHARTADQGHAGVAPARCNATF